MTLSVSQSTPRSRCCLLAINTHLHTKTLHSAGSMEPYKTELLHDMLRRVASNVEFCAIIFNYPMYCTTLALLTTTSLQSVVKAAGHCALQMTRGAYDVDEHLTPIEDGAHSLHTSSV